MEREAWVTLVQRRFLKIVLSHTLWGLGTWGGYGLYYSLDYSAIHSDIIICTMHFY